MSTGKKVLIGIGVTLAVTAAAAAGVGGYFGVVPGLSDWFGANKPRDLGVKYSRADWDKYLTKTNTQVFDFAQAPVAPARSDDTIIYADPQVKDVTLTSSEISARVNYSQWDGLPIADVQVKCGKDGVEISGRLLTDKLEKFASLAGNGGYSAADVRAGLKWLGAVGKNPAIYLKTQASVTNNAASVRVTDAQINRLPLPSDTVGQALARVTQSLAARVTGLDIKNVTFSDAGMRFSGTAPTKLYVN